MVCPNLHLNIRVCLFEQSRVEEEEERKQRGFENYML